MIAQMAESKYSFVGGLAGVLRKRSLLVIVGWIVLAAITNTLIPPLSEVGQSHSTSLSPSDAPAMVAMKRIGFLFNESDSDATAMILLESELPFGGEAHRYYKDLVSKLQSRPDSVQHIQDFWSDPLTAAGVQSADGRAAYVQLNLAGNQGETRSNESVQVVREILDSLPPPSGLRVYLTGSAPLAADMLVASDRSMTKVGLVTISVVIFMLLIAYRSFVTMLLLLTVVGIEVGVAQGVVGALATYGDLGLTPFAVSLIPVLAVAAGTDYAIFLTGRYHEARILGEDREIAYFSAVRGTSHVILASGLTVAGAMACLYFTRLPAFRTLGIPCAVGLIVVVVVALTLGPAVMSLGARFGLFEPRRSPNVRGWRKLSTVVVRWPTPILVFSCFITLIGLASLVGYTTSYNDRFYTPSDIPANIGYAAADRHFPQARMNPDVLLIEADRDLRNSADLLVLDRISKRVFGVPGVSRVQSITRPMGTPIPHSSIPYQMSMSNVTIVQNLKYMKDRMSDMLSLGEELSSTISRMKLMHALMTKLAGQTDKLVAGVEDLQDVVLDVRDNIANFDDSFRPIRNYFYWEPHCYSIPFCHSIRSVFETLDSIDQMVDPMDTMIIDMGEMNGLMPQMIDQFPSMIATMESMRVIMLTLHSTMSGLLDQIEAVSENSTAMGLAFDEAKNDDSFYLPPEVFENPDFRRGMKMFFSPDGHAVRMFINYEGDPASAEGIARVPQVAAAAHEAMKATPLEGAAVYIGGTAALFKDIENGTRYDLIIAIVGSLTLIFAVMLLLTRALVASLVIVGTVTASLGACCGISILIWQYCLGLPLQWMVFAMSIIILLAVGSDYNMLVVARIKKEVHAGYNTGIIRAMGHTGSVVTTAGLVFAFTMGSMVFSDMKSLAQAGTTIAVGLIFDTFVVRALMMPAIAARLGHWFWWPAHNVRQRPRADNYFVV